MITFAVFIVTLSLLPIVLVLASRRIKHLRTARVYISDFATSVEEISQDRRIPAELVLFLFSLAPLIDNKELARIISRHFAGIAEVCLESERDEEFKRK